MGVDYCTRADVEEVAGEDNVFKWANLDNDIGNKVGTLSTRTNDTTGIATVDAGHGISVNDTIEVVFTSGRRLAVDVDSTTDTTINFSGGTGDNLPVVDSEITVRLGAKVAARIASEITDQSEDVDSLMFGGPYSIPLENISDSTTPNVIKRTAAIKTAVGLYEHRGIEDYDAENQEAKHRLSFQEDKAERKLKEFRAGTRRIPAKTTVTTIPKAIDHYTEIADDKNLTSSVRT